MKAFLISERLESYVQPQSLIIIAFSVREILLIIKLLPATNNKQKKTNRYYAIVG